MSRLLLINVLSGIAGAMIAEQKGRNRLLWFIICVLIPPSVFVLLFLPQLPARGYTKRCPYCAEVIRYEAVVCKHCRRELPVNLVQCRGCGSFVPDGDYCDSCGKSLR